MRNNCRRYSCTIHVGPVAVGGSAPITVQSMTNTDTRDIEATIAQIHRLEAPSTRGPGWTDRWCTSCPARGTAG